MRSRTEDLVTLREELDFIESYSFLIQTRFDTSINFTIEIPAELHRLMLPPLTLQMLVENAIKHTLITEKKPLHIRIKGGAAQTIEVINTFNEKPQSKLSGSGSGLENIRMRYSHFTPKKISVTQTQQEFKVIIPLLEAK